MRRWRLGRQPAFRPDPGGGTTDEAYDRAPFVLREYRLGVERLAMGPEEQIAYLRGEGLCIADELALDFWRFASAARGLDRPVLSPRAVYLGRCIDLLTGGIAPTDELWSYDGLRTAPEWERVRTHARRLLEQIGDIGVE